jgi:alpha-glucosidase (family GH31 glycosyl hydrolase)
MVSLINHGLLGHSNTSVDMDPFTLPGMHFGFLSPWAQLNSWAYWRHPWLLDPERKQAFTEYAKLRYRLLPYIYSLAHQAHLTGMPIMRAMSLAFPDDPAWDQCTTQYMIGDALLVSSFTDHLRVPPGKWIDYWTGETYEGPDEFKYFPPSRRGGALLVRAGAILPQWHDQDFVQQQTPERIILELFPSGSSGFTLIEDDGVSFGFEKGETARTSIACEASGGKVILRIGASQGDYPNAPQTREWEIRAHLDGAPSSIEVKTSDVAYDLSPADWSFDSATGVLKFRIWQPVPVVVTIS